MSDLALPLTHHLEELRWRLIRCLLVFFGLASVLFFFVPQILTWLARPVGEFVYTSPTEAFLIQFKISGGMAVLLAFPYFLFELWRFIEQALKTTERKMVFMAVPASTTLFYFGMAAAVFVVAPNAMKFLMKFSTPQLRPMISIEAYLSFIFWMIVGFGVLFQLPLILVALCAAGVVTASQLSRYRRHAIVGIVIIAAVLTPGPDMVSQIILAVPTYILFEVALLVARGMEIRRKNSGPNITADNQ